ncbi:MAG: class I SAM-dependent methyltransferase [Microcoleaceae cyanobacterium MO_207.B10]|nr:class I SAM-dependent methyltransferase [Microcoleaceae cyanobacterium MO_207.B10]
MIEPINRTGCVVCKHTNLEPLYTIKNFPVFMGCTTAPPETDFTMDMSWVICPECGTIQLDKLVPLEILYQENHNEAIGSIWQKHHSQFADFILKYGGENRLEIGGASGKVAQLARQKNESGKWLILEPNLFDEAPAIPNTEFEQGWFDENYCSPFEVDTIIHSHVMEHLYEPRETLKQINNLLPVGGRMIFSVPNMKIWLRKKYTNCLMFEHTYYLPEEVVEFLVKEYGFKIIGKEYFSEHSIFFACEKVESISLSESTFPRNYQENLALYQDFVDSYQIQVKEIHNKIANYQGPKYIFGAHIFTLYLLAFGLQESDFLNVLDNASHKHDQRLYGTNLRVKSPEYLKKYNQALVVLKAGAYTEEIKQDIWQNINPNILFY